MSVSCFVVASNDTAKLIFRGMTMIGAEDGSIQAFLDIDIRKIESNGVGFTLRYNRNWLEVSDASDNSVLYNDFNGTFLEMNRDNFPLGFYTAPGLMYAITNTQSDYGELCVQLSANPEGQGGFAGQYVEMRDVDGVSTAIIKANMSDGLNLARISFRIKDPAKFAKLDGEEVAKIFSIATNELGENAFQINYIDRTQYPAKVFYDKNEHLDYRFEVKNTVLSIEPVNAESTVTAAEIYRGGTEQDLISYLNTYMSDIIVRYTDETTIADRIQWGDTSKDFQIDTAWDMKGGTYNISQKYNDDGAIISVKVTVTPVSILGYTAENDYVVYPLSSVPDTMAELQFPTLAKPIFDQVFSGSSGYSVSLEEAEWTQAADNPGDFFDKAEGEYAFETPITEEMLPPWVTVTTGAEKVVVLRCIGDETAAPTEEEISAVTDENGLMTVTVNRAEAFDENAEFFIRLPNAEMLSKSDFIPPAIYEGHVNADGSAVITLKGNIEADGVLKRGQQYINMGERLGNFQLSVKEPDKFRSPWVSFRSNPRTNIYTDSTCENYRDKNYDFDFTGGKSSLFAVYEDSTVDTIPLVFTIPGNDVVSVTYDGTDGSEPGGLHTVQLDSWTLVSGSFATVGGTVTLRGTLSKATYINFGEVDNPDGITITLTATVMEAVPAEKIEPIDDFVFDTQTAGFGSDKVQTAFFSVNNLGTEDISGVAVSVVSDPSVETDALQAFELNTVPAYLVKKGDSSIFAISTKVGAPIGQYVATVTVSSNRTKELCSPFKIYFEVVEGKVYRVEVRVNDSDLGSARVIGSSTYPAGATVQLAATKEEGCELDGWTVLNGVAIINIDENDPLLASFVMEEQSGESVIIQANFSGGLLAKLKLNDLQIQNEDDSINQLLKEDYTPIEFSPSVREYTVVLPNGVIKNKANFRVMDVYNNGELIPVSVSATMNGADVPVTLSETEPGRYITDLFDLPYVMPQLANDLKIILTIDEDTQREYTVHICRKAAQEDLVDFAYGNSPYGLIMRDTVKFDTPQKQQEAKEAFDTNKNQFVTDEFTPDGGFKNIRYRADAWGIANESEPGELINYDKVDEAIFIYEGQALRDPGIQSLRNSLGEPVDVSGVKRRIKVSVMSSAAADTLTLIEDFTAVDSVTVNLPTGADTGGAATEELKNLRIRPDVYTLEYIYRDYDDSELTVRRPVIILTANGNVDMRGAADAADAVKIKGRYRHKERLPFENLPTYVSGGALYKYRICDANNDGDINAVDANLLQAGAAPVKYYSEGV